MQRFKKFAVLFAFLGAISISACSSTQATPTQTATATTEVTAEATEVTAAKATIASSTLTFNNRAWQLDQDNDIYYQIGQVYCEAPEKTDNESLGIYVPGEYVTAADNGDGTYTLSISETGTLNGYTAATAPIVFPVNTAGYAAMAAPTSYNYSEVSGYLEAGFIYVYAGMRGRENGYDANNNLIYSGGAPWGVTDLKAAVRYVRYNADILPGDKDKIFVFGMSGGGAQGAVMGASGDSDLYTPYLESIGAAMTDASGQPISDAIAGVMAWCPVTSLDYADEAYEWNLGQYSTSGTRADTTWTSLLSEDLAVAYAQYINQLGLKDENGNFLTLESTTDGIYTAGSYYDYLKQTIEQSLNNFLADTTFPYTVSAGGMGSLPGGIPFSDAMPGGEPPSGGMPSGEPPSGEMPGGEPPSGEMPSGEPPSGEMPSDSPANTDIAPTEASVTTYNTAQEYIDSLNTYIQWVAYDASTNTATITSVAAFVSSQKSASKSVGAFDDLNRSQPENELFGNDQIDALHFDSVMSNLLVTNQDKYAAYTDWDTSYTESYATDLLLRDKLGSSIQNRVDMYNPMYYLLAAYEGYQTSTPAKYWRINTGNAQGDTANTVEMNLALALQNYDGVDSVEFTTVWAQGHTTAERTGDSTTNFINWVHDSVK